jgi:toxin ParE1/3/4
VIYVRRASQSPEIAERFGVSLVHKALSLAKLPERGRVVPELAIPEIREIIFKSYRIIFRTRHGSVQILRFWHAARGAPEINMDEFDM